MGVWVAADERVCGRRVALPALDVKKERHPQIRGCAHATARAAERDGTREVPR